jgi:hypothetical protein
MKVKKTSYRGHWYESWKSDDKRKHYQVRLRMADGSITIRKAQDDENSKSIIREHNRIMAKYSSN